MAEPTVTSFACSRTDAEAATEAHSRTVVLRLSTDEAVALVELLDVRCADGIDDLTPALTRLLTACQAHPAWPLMKATIAESVRKANASVRGVR